MNNRDHKIEAICKTIKTRISDINNTYRQGPDLYFYKKVYEIRQSQNISCFLEDDYNIEILYATLVSWDMNSRGAKMKYFDEFKHCLQVNKDLLKAIEVFDSGLNIDKVRLLAQLKEIYDNLNFMKTGGRLVSNSKVLHFLFPRLLMPIDRTNTLFYFYNNTSESKSKYLEIIELCLDIMQDTYNWEAHLDGNWNTTVPKMIDNAILLLVGKSTTDLLKAPINRSNGCFKQEPLS